MSSLAMSMREGTVSRYRNRYFPRSQILDFANEALENLYDFYAGIYTPIPTPGRYNKKTVREIALSGSLFFDFDAHIPEQQLTIMTHVKETVVKLQALSAPFTLFHSGRGIHIEIPSLLERPRLYLLHKYIARQLAPQADPIYDPYRVIRFPGSFNTKSRTFKTPITVDQLEVPFPELTDHCKERPCELPQVQSSRFFDQYLGETYHEFLAEFQRKRRKRSTTRKNLFPDIKNLSHRDRYCLENAWIDRKNGETRRKVTYRIAIRLKIEGLSEEETCDILTSWAITLAEKGLADSSEEEIYVDTDETVKYVFDPLNEEQIQAFQESRLDKVKEKYTNHLKNRQNRRKWKDFRRNQLKVYCAFRAMGDLWPRFFLSFSMIRKITGISCLSNGKLNYITFLEENKFIERVYYRDVEFFVPRIELQYQETNCFQVLK